MKRAYTAALATVLMMGVASVAHLAPELVENPQYVSWKAHKPGTIVSYEIKNSTGGRTTTMFMTQKLLSVDAEFATIEVVGSMKMFGFTHKAPPEREQIVAGISREQAERGVLTMDATGIVQTRPNETISVVGGTFDCKVAEFSSETPSGTSTGTAWTNDQVPGTIVKTEFRNTSAGSVMTMTLKSVKMVK